MRLERRSDPIKIITLQFVALEVLEGNTFQHGRAGNGHTVTTELSPASAVLLLVALLRHKEEFLSFFFQIYETIFCQSWVFCYYLKTTIALNLSTV